MLRQKSIGIVERNRPTPNDVPKSLTHTEHKCRPLFFVCTLGPHECCVMQEEEAITNRLMKRLSALSQEKERLAMQVEQVCAMSATADLVMRVQHGGFWL